MAQARRGRASARDATITVPGARATKERVELVFCAVSSSEKSAELGEDLLSGVRPDERLGFSLHSATHERMSFSSAWTERWSERRSRSSVRYANQRSTWLIQLE